MRWIFITSLLYGVEWKRFVLDKDDSGWPTRKAEFFQECADTADSDLKPEIFLV
jgi:hypothetical protein